MNNSTTGNKRFIAIYCSLHFTSYFHVKDETIEKSIVQGFIEAPSIGAAWDNYETRLKADYSPEYTKWILERSILYEVQKSGSTWRSL